VRHRNLTGLTLCLLTATLWALAVGVGPIAWAAPQVGPLAQTVPTATPVRPRPSTPAASEEQPSPAATQPPIGTAAPAVTPGSQAPGTPAASAQPPVGAPTQSSPVQATPRQAAPTAAWQTAEAIGAAPPALPALRQCASAITPAAAVSLPPIYDSSGPVSLAWLVLLGVGTMLVGLGLVLISRKDA
jgi:hypothetical protein